MKLDGLRDSRNRYRLYAVVAALLAVAWVGLEVHRRLSVVDPGWENLDFAAIEEVALLQRFIQVDTSHATGSELEGARFLAGVLDSEGIETEILDMGHGLANLIARIPGSGEGTVILHNHLDVDPIDKPEVWEHSPYSGVIEPPWIYGRGAFDMKSVTIAQVMALLDLKRSGLTPERTVIFLATSSEETDSRAGVRWLLRNRPELFRNVWALLSEGGVLEARAIDDIKYWGTEVYQKRFLKIHACSASRERLEDLRSDILATGRRVDGLRVAPEIRSFAVAYAPSRDHPDHRSALGAPDALVRDVAAFDALPAYQQSLFRDEIYPFPVSEGSEEGAGFHLRVTLSLLPGSDPERELERFLPPWMTAGVRIVVDPDPSGLTGSDPRHPLLSLLAGVLDETYGETLSGPYVLGASATDSRYFRAYGLPAFGFTPFLAMTTDTLGIAGPNEGIALPAFIAGVELYRDVVRRAVGAPPLKHAD